ncbi:MAG: exodeoxyribonuclease VII small subunit [Chloroflexi bacterium]|nr:exodeoxyribonuclease VII small subunit [Chloroflexota bacterium]
MSTPAAALSFDEALQALQEAVDRLEGGELPLERALEIFEEGTKLARECSAYLDQAELRIRELQVGDAASLESEEDDPNPEDLPA